MKAPSPAWDFPFLPYGCRGKDGALNGVFLQGLHGSGRVKSLMNDFAHGLDHVTGLFVLEDVPSR